MHILYNDLFIPSFKVFGDFLFCFTFFQYIYSPLKIDFLKEVEMVIFFKNTTLSNTNYLLTTPFVPFF